MAKNETLIGTIKTTAKGMGFVTLLDHDESIVIEPDFLNTALNNDTVEIILAGKRFNVKKGPSTKTGMQGEFNEQMGQVVKIVERAKTDFVGTLMRNSSNQWIVSPDDRRVYVNILIPTLTVSESHEGEKVLAHMTRWEKGQPQPEGTVTLVIGKKGVHETEIQSIILDRGIDTHFPPEVEKEADEIQRTEKPLNSDEIKKRKDFRSTLTFTIDPVDAKDFDDALSLKDMGNGLYEIGVHIADVSYYVREGTELNREALKRATSVYLVDRTIPMLPEVLSNDLCSLNPNEDRFSFAAVFVMDMQGKIHEKWFGRTVINSDKRFSYETAQESLNTKGEYFNELDILNKISYKLRQEKYNNGAIDFETEEVKFKLDANGKPLEVVKKQRLDTHKLIEDFMLLANREVAKFIYDAIKNHTESASIYRIHDLPDKDRMEELALFIKALGYNLPVKQGTVTSRDINALLKTIEGKPEESLIKTATIRSMAKAIYSTKNIGHFGLAFTYYTHFTSPIRRYPDLLVHRILQNVLDKNIQKVKDQWKTYEHIATHSTEKEIAAAEAERASIKYKQVEYMSAHIGETFQGSISGVTDWGLYIEEVNTKCEGMIPLRELGNDFYTLNKKTYTIEGQRTKKKYRLGDKVTFKVMKADLEAKTLEYKF